jgi:hypothetical protein
VKNFMNNNILKLENLFVWQWKESYWINIVGSNEGLINAWKRNNRRARKKRL